jgi:ABC-type branched-subunit amino acid transport system substrate-binding protein
MRVGMTALTLTGAVVVVGCGGDEKGGGSTSSGGTQTTSSSDFSGKPVKVYFMGPVDSPVSDLKSAISALEVGIGAINNGGGLGGREVQLETCPDNTANDETACAQKAIDDGAVAFIGSSSLFNAVAFNEALTKNNIPNIAPLALQQTEYSPPTSFPIFTTSFGIITCAQQMRDAAGSKTFAGITQEVPSQKELLKTLQGVAAATGLDYKAGVAVPQQQTDFSAAVKELQDSGADTVVNILAPPIQPAFYQALNSVGAKFKFCGSTSSFNLDVLKQIGDAANEIYVSIGLPTSTKDTGVPVLDEFYEQMKAAADGGDENADPDTFASAEALNAWLGVKILKQASESVKGELTPESLLAAMDKTKVEFAEVTPPLDFSKPLEGPFPRLFNPMVTLTKWNTETEQYEPVDGAKPTNVLETFAALAG